MRKIYSFLASLIVLFIVSSAVVNQKTSSGLFEKSIWVELDASGKDSVLFKPYSKAWKEMWGMIDPEISFYGTPVMNYERYKFSFDKRTDNLFTIIHPMITDGSLQVYSPYNPKSMGLGVRDDGELRYPLNDKNESLLTSETFRENICYYLGEFGPQPNIPMTDEYGDPMIKVDSISGIEMYVYPPRDFIWYEDADLIKYKLRVSVFYDKNGIEKKRIVKSIAPVVYQIYDGQIEGEKELFWLNFNDLTAVLKKAYYFDETGKPVSYLKHIHQKVLNAAI